MARLPSWRDTMANSYTNARRWGTGVNRVHYQRDSGGREIAVSPYRGQTDIHVDDAWGIDDGSYTQHDDATFMRAHPNLGDPGVRADTDDRPPWGYGQYPTPQGTGFRAYKLGYNPRENEPGAMPVGEAGEGWTNKPVKGPVLDSDDPAPEQLYVQTSMRQRDVSKDNNRAQARATDDAREPIASRIMGMRRKVWSGGQRHEDMFPFQATYTPRPFIYRMAGAGPDEYLDPNAMYVSEPITRVPPPDVYQGVEETAIPGTSSGLTSEDFYYG